MTFALLALASWATAVASQGCDINGIVGSGYGPGALDSDLERAVMEANRQPNATNEVQFQLTRPGASAAEQNSASNQWSWRINITEINIGSLPSAPDNFHESGDPSNYNFVNTVHSLSWPRGGELSNELARVTGNATGNAGRLCMTVVDMPQLPVNITNQYDPGDNGNCANVIGAGCAQAMLAHAAPSEGGCNDVINPLPEEIPECKSTFAQARCDGITTYALANTTGSNLMSPHPNDPSNSTAFRSGDAFYFFASAPEAAGNHSHLQAAGQQLQIIMLTGAANQIVCQKVNMTDVTTSNAASSTKAPWYASMASLGLLALFTQL